MIERLSFIYLSSKSKYTDKDTERLQIFFVVKINNVNICLNGCNLTLKPCYICFQPYGSFLQIALLSKSHAFNNMSGITYIRFKS